MKREPVRDENGIIIYDPSDDFDISRKDYLSTEDNERLQRILKEKRKVTWGDVYAKAIANKDKFPDTVTPEVWSILNHDPTTEMMCVLDEYDGKFYWMPKMNSKYIGRTLAVHDLEDNLVWSIDDQKQTMFQKIKNWWKTILSLIILLLSILPMVAQVFNPEIVLNGILASITSIHTIASCKLKPLLI